MKLPGKANYQLSTINYQLFKPAYTLIELLIVLSLIGIATALVTTAYLGFERRERVKASALALQNNIRLAQNSAHSGNKGFEGDKCDTAAGEILIGWYVTIDGGSQTYTITGDCLSSAIPPMERKFSEKTFKLAKDVNFLSINTVSPLSIMFRPLVENATFHSSAASSGVDPDFIDDTSHELINPLGADEIIMVLKGTSPYKYQVRVNLAGGVSAKRI